MHPEGAPPQTPQTYAPAPTPIGTPMTPMEPGGAEIMPEGQEPTGEGEESEVPLSGEVPEGTTPIPETEKPE